MASCEDSIGCMHGSSEPDLRNWKARCTHLQTQPGRIQPIDSSQLAPVVGRFWFDCNDPRGDGGGGRMR
ncbi:hypothetical protein L570_1943 [Bordetella pertussis 2356847]|nr:hypothetical protein L570_1943 [Bordetella pertussis 2356847]